MQEAGTLNFRRPPPPKFSTSAADEGSQDKGPREPSNWLPGPRDLGLTYGDNVTSVFAASAPAATATDGTRAGLSDEPLGG